nr:hypothetical protein [uncultured Duganella sp.]
MFILSLLGLGITLSPLVRLIFWIASKISPKFAETRGKALYALAPFSWFAGLGALFAVIIITALAQRELPLAWMLPLLSIFLYFMYSIYLSASSQLVELARVVQSPVDTRLQSDYSTRDKMAKLKVSRWVAPFFIIAVPLLMGGATGELLDASMRAAKIRLESPVVHIKEPYSSLMPKSLVASTIQAPADYVAYEGATVLFNGFGTLTVLSFQDGIKRRTLDVPNEYIIVERR